MAVLVEDNVNGDAIRGLGPAVDVDEGVDAPVLQQPVSGDVVMCGIKADIFGGREAVSEADSRYAQGGKLPVRTWRICKAAGCWRPDQVPGAV